VAWIPPAGLFAIRYGLWAATGNIAIRYWLFAAPGSEARNSIGTILVAGMSVGTIFTLFVVPVFYSLIAAQHQPSLVDEEIEETQPRREVWPAREEVLVGG